jgi:dolichol kinase
MSKLSALREEAKRKTVHICGIAIPVLYLFLPKDLIVLGFVLSLFIIFIIEWLRFRGVVSLPFLRKKEEEKKEIGAYVFFVIGAFISILIFEKSIAIAAICMLAIGDAASALAGEVMNVNNPGMRGKRMKPPAVMLVMFITSLVIGCLVLHSLPVAVCGALGATIADGVPFKVQKVEIDDNLTIPLFSGLMMSFGSLW